MNKRPTKTPAVPTSRPTSAAKTPAGVVQELLGLSLAHFVIRKTMFDAAAQHRVDPDRLSFTGAFQTLQTRLPECPPRASPTQLQTWYKNLLAEIADERVPLRRNRLNPRVIKRGRNKWPSKKPIHYGLAKLQKTCAESILIH